MNERPPSPEELSRACGRYCDETISAEELASLERWLSDDRASMKQFLLYMEIHSAVAWQGRSSVDVHPAAPGGPSAGEVSAEARLGGIGFGAVARDGAVGNLPPLVLDPRPVTDQQHGEGLSLAASQLAARSKFAFPVLVKWVGSPVSVTAFIVCVVIALSAWRGLARKDRTPSASSIAAVDDADNAAADFVARIVGMTHNTTWQDPHVKVDSMFRLSADETIRIATGLVKIEFYSGATVILQSPAVFTPTGPGSGRLDRGRLTGRAANGNFRLTTDAADVIDLGTEFGVAVDDAAVTDVVVFDGEVEVISLAARATAGGVLRMTEGMAARFTPAGATEHDFPARPEGFSRSLSPARDVAVDGELSLVDVICGGSGFDNYVAGAIDPRTGKTDSGVWLRSRVAGRRRGEGLFCPTRHRPPLDGVFIPPVDGRPAQIDSLGHTVVLPVWTSQTFGPIWARRQTNALGSAEGAIDYWGPDTFADVNRRLQSARHGVIGLHANVGFTIDLQAVRMRQHRQVNGFETVLAIPAAYRANHNPENLDAAQTAVDFHVYVDGVLRDKRLSIKRADGDIRFAFPLTPSHQRLTLVVTDSEQSIIFDNFVLIDPVLTLDKTAQGRAAE